MAKKHLHQSVSDVATPNGIGRINEQNIIVDDNCLPTPQELEAYQNLDPNLLPFFMKIAEKEQAHRHKMESEKTILVKWVERRTYKTNFWGMFFAFLLTLSMILSVYAIYLGHVVLGSIFGGGSFVAIIGTFAKRTPEHKSK